MSYKLVLSFTLFTFLSIVTYAAQETRNPVYKPKETNQNTNTESTTILIFKAPIPSNENGTVKKAGRAERTTAIPSINRLKADTRKYTGISMNA
jgi:hypothetical protein